MGRALNQFVAALQRFGIGRLAAILGIGAGVAAALIAVTMNLGQPKALLYSNLDMREASSITQALDQAGRAARETVRQQETSDDRPSDPPLPDQPGH